jgi:hypothetical protein
MARNTDRVGIAHRAALVMGGPIFTAFFIGLAFSLFVQTLGHIWRKSS